MTHNKPVLSMHTYSALLLISLLSLTNIAEANFGNLTDPLDLINTSCPSGAEHYSKLKELKTEIITADSVKQARALALAPTDSAIDALNSANAMLPNSEELNAAKLRLDEARSRIRAASTQPTSRR